MKMTIDIKELTKNKPMKMSSDETKMVKEGINNGDLKDQMETIKSTVDQSSGNMLTAVSSAIKAGYK